MKVRGLAHILYAFDPIQPPLSAAHEYEFKKWMYIKHKK